MNISYNWLRELTGARLTAGELRERLTMAGLEVEAVHEAGDDFVLEIAVLSNRPDLLSHLGVAREVCTLTGGALRWPEMRAARAEGTTESLTSVEIEAADLCPRFTARVVRGVRIAPSPAWLVARLEAVGQRPINNVADITNYVMLELGQPLHAFDLEKLAERRLVVRRARAGERLRTLDGIERELDTEMLVIADAARAIAIAGVMGGAETEISETTRDVLIEAAHFAPASVRRTSRVLGLQTEASDRFERGIDYEGQLRAQARAAALITELAGGTATADAIDVYTQAPAPPIVSLRFARVRELTGLDVPPQESLRILRSLGIELTSENGAAQPAVDAGAAQLAGEAGAQGEAGAPGAAVNAAEAAEFGAQAKFVSPSWRADIQIEEDLVEEVGRHFGYDKVSDTLPAANVAGEYRAHEWRRREARRALNACGFDEALTFSFIDTAHDEQFDLLPGLISRATDDPTRFVTLNNPIIEGAARMRPTLLNGLLESVRRNFNHGTRDVRLFEMGRIFAADAETGGQPREIEACALVATGVAIEAGHAGASRELDFYDLKGALEAALEAANIVAPQFVETSARHLREGQAAQILHAGRAVGTLGRLADEVAAAYKFKQPIYVAEVDLASLLAAVETGVRYAPLARFPAVVRDASLVAPRRVTFAQMQHTVLGLNLEHVRRVALVYVYEGERVPEGQRSVTLRIEYRADDRTLRDQEVDELHARIVGALEEKFGAQLKR
ncbi:MAG TPA: phenylalanine--tRNA ligase subunit beta [Pyrinomonadaceae bacterium]|nr:phenylalanine--tRNA ligase subunit beta [Pyrinomonadaceae bacterium]